MGLGTARIVLPSKPDKAVLTTQTKDAGLSLPGNAISPLTFPALSKCSIIYSHQTHCALYHKSATMLCILGVLFLEYLYLLLQSTWRRGHWSFFLFQVF